jgi:hypothetical protein
VDRTAGELFFSHLLRSRRERAAVALVEPDTRGGPRARSGRHAALPRVRPHRDHGRLGRDR